MAISGLVGRSQAKGQKRMNQQEVMMLAKTMGVMISGRPEFEQSVARFGKHHYFLLVHAFLSFSLASAHQTADCHACSVTQDSFKPCAISSSVSPCHCFGMV